MSLLDSFSSLSDLVTGISPLSQTEPLPHVRLGDLVARDPYRPGGGESVSLVTIVVNLGR